jgi:hypothetical protein
MEALEAPIVTVCELRQVKAVPLNIRALIVGIVWTGVADVCTPPLRNPPSQVCVIWVVEWKYSQGPLDELVQHQKPQEEKFPS